MAKRIPEDVKIAVAKAFPSLTVSSVAAPQGQNSFCFNLRLEDNKGGQFLVKAIRTQKATVKDPGAALEEVRAAAAVRSPHFVPLLDTKTVGGYTFLLFPFLQGNNLAEHLHARGGILPEAEVKEIGINLLRGVSDLSRKNIRHQDIKLENIFITDDGDVKILDFGSARFNKASFKGSTRINRSHSAPEQILASRPANLEALRLTCDERSDVYSVGSVLYQLVTGQTAFVSNDEKLESLPPRPIAVAGVSDGLKRILNRLLSHHPRNRPHATQAAAFLEAGDVQAPTVARGGFFYNASTSLKRLQEVYDQDDGLFGGIIVDASKYPSSDQEYLRNSELLAIVDPQTYLFQAPKLINAKFKKLPYYQLAKSGTNVGIEFVTDKDALINSVFDYEIAAGADILLPPFFLIKEFNDTSWTFDAEVTQRALEVYRKRGLQLPLLKGVAVAENVLLSDVTRGRLLDHLTNTDWLTDTAGYFVLLENGNGNGYPSEPWLKAAKELLAGLLSTGKVVIWSHAYLPAITFAHSGVGLGMGEAQSQKSFSLSEDLPTMKTPSPHLYLPKLFARIKWPTGIQALNTHKHPRVKDFVCSDPCCAGVDFSNPATRGERELALHAIRQLGLQFKKYSGSGGAAKERADIETAQKIYEEFKANSSPLFKVAMGKELKPNTGTFLGGWLNAFH